MQHAKKYEVLFWALTLLWTAVFTSLGVIALTQKKIYVVTRFWEGLSQGLAAEITGWVFLATGLAALAYQFRSSNFILSSYAVYILYVISLVIYLVV